MFPSSSNTNSSNWPFEIIVKLSIEHAHFKDLHQPDHDGVYSVGKCKTPLYHFTVYLTENYRDILLSATIEFDHKMWKQGNVFDIELPDIETFNCESYSYIW